MANFESLDVLSVIPSILIILIFSTVVIPSPVWLSVTSVFRIQNARRLNRFVLYFFVVVLGVIVFLIISTVLILSGLSTDASSAGGVVVIGLTLFTTLIGSSAAIQIARQKFLVGGFLQEQIEIDSDRFPGDLQEAIRKAIREDPKILEIQTWDMKNPLNMNDAYVDLRLIRSLHHTTQADRREEWNRLKEQLHRINDDELEAIDPIKAVHRYSRCIFAGEPGSGKTTILKNMTLKAAGEQKDKDLPFLPIFISLQDLVSRYGPVHSPSQLTVSDFLDYLSHSLSELYDFTYAETSRFVPNLFNKEEDNLLLLFDGLDETLVGDSFKEVYKSVVDLIGDIASKYKKLRIVVTVRKATYLEQGYISGFSMFQVQPLSLGDAKRIMANHFPKILSWDNKDIMELYNTIRGNWQLRNLASNPLFVRLMTETYQHDANNLSGNRSQFYEQCAEYLVYRWDTIRNIVRTPVVKITDMYMLLGQLAFIFQLRGMHVLSKEEILVEIVNFQKTHPETFSNLVASDPHETAQNILHRIVSQGGLIKKNEAGNYEFVYFVLQEYFAAKYFTKASESVMKVLSEYYYLQRWKEVAILYTAYATNQDVSQFVQKILHRRNDQNDPDEDFFHNDLCFAGHCLEVVNVSEGLLDHKQIVEDLFGVLDSTPYSQARNEIAEALVSVGTLDIILRLKTYFNRVAHDTSDESAWNICYSIVRGLVKTSNGSLNLFLFNLLRGDSNHSDPQMPYTENNLRKQVAITLGRLINDDSIIAKMFGILGDNKGESHLRINMAQALGESGDPKVARNLFNNLAWIDNVSVIRSVIDALIEINEPELAPYLFNLLKQGTSVLDKDGDREVRRHITFALGRLKNREISHDLARLLGSDKLDLRADQIDSAVGYDIASTLASLGDRSVVKELQSHYYTLLNNPSLQCYVATALYRLGDTSIRLPSLDDTNVISDSYLVKEILFALEEDLSREITDSLLEKLNVDNREKLHPEVLISIVDALSKRSQYSQEIVPALMQLLEDSKLDVKLRRTAAKALGDLNDTTIRHHAEAMPGQFVVTSQDILGKLWNMLEDEKVPISIRESITGTVEKLIMSKEIETVEAGQERLIALLNQPEMAYFDHQQLRDNVHFALLMISQRLPGRLVVKNKITGSIHIIDKK